MINPGESVVDKRRSVLFNHQANQEDQEIDKFYMRELGKKTSKSSNWNNKPHQSGDVKLSTLAATLQLEDTSYLFGRGVVLWTLVRWMWPAGRQEDKRTRIVVYSYCISRQQESFRKV